MGRTSLLPVVLAAFDACAAEAELHDIRGPVPLETLPPFALTGAVLLLAGGLSLVLARRRRPSEPPPPPASRPDDDPLAGLVADYRRGVCPGELLILRLDALVRDALAARRLTSAELRRRLGPDEVLRAQLDGFLTLADRVKFAGHRPDAAEIEAALRAAAALLAGRAP